MNLRPLIATPCYGGVVAHEHKDAMVDLAVNLTQVGISFRTYSLANESIVDRARNECVAEFLEDESLTHLFFIDADIAFRPQDFYDMLVSSLDFVVGPYRKKHPTEQWTTTFLPGPQEIFSIPSAPSKRFMECAEGGTGFMCLSRWAVTRLQEVSALYVGGVESSRTCWDVFRCPIDAGVRIGEDQYVCRRWRELGGQVWCSLGAKLGHVGHGMIYRGDFVRHLEVSSPGLILPVRS